MAYKVLARKFRPQTFEDVYAQDHITKILQNAIEMERIAHAYLFTGPRGVGKTSMARIFTKSLNCENGPTTSPCNKCSNCLEITNGTSTDVSEIDGASNTSVDDVRDLQKELLYSTSKSKYKIYIIDEVHMLSKSAFNALLKTLEEPPNNVIFIFATTEPHKVLPTIISRCQRFDFKRIPIDSIVKRIDEICKKEEIDIEEGAIFAIAKKADGSLRDALSLLDQVISSGNKLITAESVQDIFGIVDNEVFLKIIQFITEQNSAELLKTLRSVLDQGKDIQELINGILEFCRNMLLLRLNLDVPELNKDILPRAKEIAKQLTENTILYYMSFLVKAKDDIKKSDNQIIIAEMVFLKLSKIQEMQSIPKLIDSFKNSRNNIIRSKPQVSDRKISYKTSSKINQPVQTSYSSQPKRNNYQQNRSQNVTKKEKTIHNNVISEKKKINKTEPKIDSLTEDIYNDARNILIQKIKRKKAFTVNYFIKAKLIKIVNDFVHFVVKSEVAYKRLMPEKELISEIFSNHFGIKIIVDFKLEKDDQKKKKLPS